VRLKDPLNDFIRLVPGYLPFTLNGDQQEALGKIAAFILQSDDRSTFILKGYAGTGKTSLISAVTMALPSLRWRSVLLAPTGRAAKVLSAYAKRPAVTIHKKIYFKNTDGDGGVRFVPADNLHRNTLFIVDEASMIGADTGEGGFGSLLGDLFEYVYSGDNCKLLLMGDSAQLPPVGSDLSPALDLDYLRNAFHLSLFSAELKEVARQKLESGILLNATLIREQMQRDGFSFPLLIPTADFARLGGEDLADTLNAELSKHGEENVIIITRSNKRAGLYNRSYRNLIRLQEEDLSAGDRLMIVKNNYFWLGEGSGDTGFIANGDMAEITRIVKREEAYGFHFCDCQLRLCDYPNLPELTVKLVTDCLYSDEPALSQTAQKQLYEAVLADAAGEPSRALRMAHLRKSPHYHALQVKFAYAITCHKAQGGQWPVVFIDQGYLPPDGLDLSYARWLYTAVTRASGKVYLVNFSDSFFEGSEAKLT
jgi:exodeoxyribonuclease V